MNKFVTNVLKVISISALAVSLTACGSSNADSAATDVPTVTLWSNGGQEVGDALNAIAQKFNTDPVYSKKAKLEVQFIVSGTNEQSLVDRLAATYQAGEKDTDFDLIAIDDSVISGVLAKTSQDFFEPIDTSKLENYDNLIFKENVVGDTFVPYRGTSVMLAYNSDVVKNPPKNQDELTDWIKNNPGRFAYCDPSTGGSGVAVVLNSVYNQLPDEARLSAEEKWMNDFPTEWDNGFEYLKEIHPYLYQTAGKVQYPMKNAGSLDLLETNQIDMTPAYVNMVLSRKAMGVLPDSIKLTQIEPAYMGALAGLLIPSIGKDKEAAYSVIDYFLTYEAQAIDWNKMYASPVVDANKLENLEHEDWLKETNMDDLRYFSIGILQNEIMKRWMSEVAPLAK